MIINGRTHYLFLNPIFSCKLFKDYVKVMTVALDTIHDTEKIVDVFSDELENKISDFHNTLDPGLQNIAITIKSSTSTSNKNHNYVMKGMNEKELARGFIIKYTLDIKGLPCGWYDFKPSFMDSKYVGNVSALWKAWHEETVDVITKNKHHSEKWSAYLKLAELKKIAVYVLSLITFFVKQKGIGIAFRGSCKNWMLRKTKQNYRQCTQESRSMKKNNLPWFEV
jgi:hypothetical protein